MNLFVYGTLRNTHDHPMAQLLRQNARLLGHGYVAGRLFDLGWYPGATYEPDSPHRVWGDVFTLTDVSILPQLDDYEVVTNPPGQPSADDEYARRDVPVQLVSNAAGEPVCPREVRCQMYVFLRTNEQLAWIESGNFLTR